jgi:hypothetical protein
MKTWAEVQRDLLVKLTPVAIPEETQLSVLEEFRQTLKEEILLDLEKIDQQKVEATNVKDYSR